MLSAILMTKAEENNEVYNYVSDDYKSIIEDTPIVRKINGGTIIIPEFDESCPEDIKTPFTYACKIVEEYIPPCLPLRVKVSVANLSGSQRNAISKVSNAVYEKFGGTTYYDNATMSTIKGVIFGELCLGSDVTYLKHIPNVDFLNSKPDITITYNKQKLDDISFSLGVNPGEKYDFISVAIRDIIRGLGFYHNFIYNPLDNEIQNNKDTKLPFEVKIDEALGLNLSPNERLANATQGELPIFQSLKLYAPETWENGVSLNYFIPNDAYQISKILSHEFSKGMVYRSLNENSIYIFSELLGWKYSYVTSVESSKTSSSGTTDLKVDLSGTLNIGEFDSSNGINSIIDFTDFIYPQVVTENDPVIDEGSQAVIDHEKALEYVNQYHPIYYDNKVMDTDCFTLSILKKNGTWDVVFFFDLYFPGIPYELQMSECTFHCDPDEYERTVDGYLKARLSTRFMNNNRAIELNSTYFVIDYLPPKVKLRYNYVNNNIDELSDAVASTNAITNNVRLYFSDIEGVDYIILEAQKQGARVPTKLRINDVKEGFIDRKIDKTTTFTAVAYNKNGQTRGIPVTIELINNTEASLNFQMQDDTITVNATEGETGEFDFSIMPLTASASQFSIGGNSDGEIDISSLPQGLYVLNVTDYKTGLNGTFKFKK